MDHHSFLRQTRRRFLQVGALLLIGSVFYVGIQALLLISGSPFFLNSSLLIWGGFCLFLLHGTFAMVTYQLSEAVENSYAETSLLVAASFFPLAWCLSLVTLISRTNEELEKGKMAGRDQQAVSELMASGIHLDPDPVVAMREIYLLHHKGAISEQERERIARLLADKEI